MAARFNDVESAKLLMEYGADIAARNNVIFYPLKVIVNFKQDGDTPLHIAAKWDTIEIIKLLLKKCNDASMVCPHAEAEYIDMVNNADKTPLYLAVLAGSSKIAVPFLINRGANLNILSDLSQSRAGVILDGLLSAFSDVEKDEESSHSKCGVSGYSAWVNRSSLPFPSNNVLR